MLKIRSGFSFRAAAGKIENVLDRLQEIGSDYAPITDRSSTFAFYRWKKEAEKRGLKPCFGVELAVTTSINAKKPSVDWFTFVAQDSVEPINELVTLATTQFRYQPLLTLEQALEARHKCSVMTGHRPQLDWESPIEGVHVMLGPSTSRAIAKRALENGWAFAASSDNRFPTAADKGFYEVLTGRNAETQTYPQWILDDEEWLDSIEHLGLPMDVINKAVGNSRRILREHVATLLKSSLPKFKATKTLKELCWQGSFDLACDLSRPEYETRLERELALIKEKGYEDYFYIVADICNWARGRMLVGPARGSSCGSLVCYLLGITTVDPIPFGLIFERFVDVNRSDMPDIDIDFSDQQRSQVFKYIEQKYGREHVARLGAVAMFQPRSALVEVGTALSIPKWKCDAVAESMIERSSGDSRALNTLEDTLTAMPAGRRLIEDHPEALVVTQFEGHPRHYCLKFDTKVKIGQTNHVLKGEMAIADLWSLYINSPSEDTARARRQGKPRMPTLVSMEGDGRCRPQKAIDIWPSGIRPCVRLVFSDGSEIECTSDHKFLIDGEWKPCGEAKIGSEFRSLKKFQAVHPNKDYWKGKKRPDFSLTGTGKLQKGEAHPNFRNSIANRMIHQKAEHKSLLCDDCNSKAWTDLHHNDHNHGKDRPDDIAFLCKSCHRKRHGGENRRWKNGIETDNVQLVARYGIGSWPTFDIEMPVHHNFVLANGIITSNSQHAAGVVISADPISKFVAVDHRTGATMCDKKDAEDGYNLLKIDCLGLTQLSVFEDALALAGLPHDHLESLPLDDPEAFRVLNEAKWSGIFQFNGQALQSITKQFEVDKFDDIVSVTALGRPGPLASGGAHEWIRRRNGNNPVTYPHPIFEPYLKDTLGIVLYQESVMEIGRNIGGLNWEQVTALRKAMSKSLGKEYFDQFGDPWKAGAIAKGVDPVKADKIWDDLCAYGAWSFNKSHSVAYGIISYWCCWLKAHHPFEFAAATLSHENDPMRQIQLLREMKAEGYDYVPIDPELSGRKWTVGERAGKRYLVGPLHNVKGIGPKMVNQIVGARNRGESIPDRCKKLLTNPKTDIDSLWPIRDGVARHCPDPLAMNIVTHPTPIIEAQVNGVDQEFLFFAVLSKINPRDENEVVIVARRGYEIRDGKTTSLNVQITDDTDTLFGKITRWDYERLGRPIVDRGRVGKALYAIKGKMRANTSFRMVTVTHVRYLGDLDK